MPARSSGPRNDFSDKEDDFLAQYIAKYNPQREGRTGNKLYERLVENAEGKWPWHKRHTWQSWRERYRNHQAEFDRRIAKHLRKASDKAATKSKSSGRAASPRRVPAPAPAPAPAPESPPSEKRERVSYTMEDDDNLAEYLATRSLSHRGRQGKNLYEAIMDEPWGERHSWQSWHERYRKNHRYFDRRIQRILADEDDGDGDESDFPRPRTVDGATHYSLSQARAHATREKEKVKGKEQEKEKEREKRKRTSRGDEGGEAPPRKKTRVEQPVAGPSKREPEIVEAPEKPEMEVARVPDGLEDERPQDDGGEQLGVKDEVQDGEGGGKDEEKEAQDEPEEDDEDDENDDAEQGLIGSDDYCGEIFDEPAPEVEAEGQDDGSESESDREQEEAELMLSDNPFPDAQDMDEAPSESADADADADVDIGGDETVVEEGDVRLQGRGGHDDENPFDDNDRSPHDVPIADDDEVEPHLSTTPPSGASPPARAHNSRIEHDIDAQPDTPELSPAEDANARRRRDHGHEPAPARKHAKRILRKRGGDEDFFGTPSTSAGGTAQNSPTARHLARRTPRVGHGGGHGHGDGEDGGSPQKRQREPPRLDEGAWNTAFSDARGRTRASPKRPRRSGVDFEFEDVEAKEVGGDEGQAAQEDGDVDSAALQWPPVRGGAKNKGKAREEVAVPATPARGARDKGKAREVAASPGEGRVVTTEHILSVKTIRTVERRPANGTGTAVEAAHEPARDQSSSPRTLVQEDGEGEEEEAKVEPTQRHPFSQLEPRESRGASSSRGSSIFPLVGGGANGSRKADIARMQKMLAASRRAAPEEKQVEDKDMDMDTTNKKHHTSLGTTTKVEPLSDFLQMLANGGGPKSASDVFPRSMRRKSPAATTEDPRGRGQRLTRFQEREESLPMPESLPPLQSSPLARRGSNPAVDEILPNTSTARAAQGAPKALLPLRVDKGKARENAPPSSATDSYGHSRRRTTTELKTDSNPAPQAQSSLVRRNRHAPRQSLPAMPSFTLEEDPYMALSHMFHPPPSGSGLARVYTLPSSRPSLPRSSSDPPLYASLPAHERVMVKELGIQCMLAAMARNHGFGLEIVRGVFEKAGSMEKTDRVLRDMRESANRQANVSFRQMFSESGGEQGGEQDEDAASGEDSAEGEEEEDEELEGAEDAEEADEDALADDADAVDEEHLPDSSGEADEGDSAEVESVLGQDANSWLDDAPQAESSRIRGGAAGYSEDGMDVDVDVSRVTSGSTRKAFRIKMLPKEPVPAVVYSPPKKTRASHFIKKSQKADLSQSPQRGQDAIAVDADPFTIAERPAKPRYADLPVGSIGQLAKYGAEEWSGVEDKYGPGAAKIMMGKALAKLLPGYRQ